MRYSIKQKFIITALLCAGTVTASLYIFFWLVSTIQNSEANLEEIKSNVSIYEMDRAAIRLSEKIISEYGFSITRVNEFFIDDKRPINFIEDIQDLAKKTENSIELNLREGSDQKGWIDFLIKIEGSEKNVLDYLTLLELMPYEIRIKDLKYQTRVSEKSALLNLTIQVKTKKAPDLTLL